MRGLTAAYLMRRIWDFKKGDTILLRMQPVAWACWCRSGQSWKA
jgi:cytochrome c553